MAFKISKKDDERLCGLRDRIHQARQELDAVVNKEVAIIEDAYAAMNTEIERYNNVLDEARGVIEDIAGEMEGQFDDRSDSWQEGERGDITRTWIEELQNLHENELEAIEEFAFEPPAMDFEDHGDKIDNLEREPSY